MAKGTHRHASLGRLLAYGAGIWFVWQLTSKLRAGTSEFSVVDGRHYEFTIVAHPYGDASEWSEAVEAALTESGAHSLTVLSRTPSDVVLRFVKKSPITTTIARHAVLYPNDPPLATATLLDVRPAPIPKTSGVIPLGGSA